MSKKTISAVLCAMLLSASAYVIYAAGVQSTKGLLRDANNQPVQSPPAEQMTDAVLGPFAITTVQVTGNVAIVTTGVAHGFSVGQTVTVAGATLTEFNTTGAVITTISSSTIFRYALTHADEGPTADATGTASAQNVSPIATGTTQITLQFPPGAMHLVVNPITANASVYGATGVTTSGTRTVYSNTANHVDGNEGDKIYIDRHSNTTTLEFVFDKLR